MPISDYALIGDTRTAALVSSDGAIDWLCLPRFDAEPVFGRLIGGPEAGIFRVGPAEPYEVVRRRYHPGATTLETAWRTDGAELIAVDAMVSETHGHMLPSTVLVRRVEVHGRPAGVDVMLDPVRSRAERPRWSRRGQALVASWGDLALAVCDGGAGIVPGEHARVALEPGRPLTITLTAAHRQPLIYVPPAAGWQAVQDSERWWRGWVANVRYDGPRRDEVIRSLITLKLLTYSPSGAPVAAPTSSLPEKPGGDWNWDYRYAWPRDASIGIATFLGLGCSDEAEAFFYWLLHATRLNRPRLPPALTLYGNPVPDEWTLEWPGYRDSRPVRFGNVVGRQHQLDVYGFVLDAASILSDQSKPLFPETWRALRGSADHVARHWREPGNGIWETRGEPRQWVHSKLFAWLALDRAQRIGRQRGEKGARLQRWEAAKNAVHAEVLERGFDSRRQTYVGEYDRPELDGALLLLPVIGMEPATSPRVVGTVDAVRRELHAGGPLFHRHAPNGEGAFLPVSFWMVQALALCGHRDEAHELFERLLTVGAPLGLLSEEVDPASGELLGNYPQALSHAALLQAALALQDATGH
ncbi:MAG: glycoside hydrolase family 15 protein [Actinobacteria bacterium]|nr:glycoside hydrolase family 15 protein [Actinomycetota bacterium]